MAGVTGTDNVCHYNTYNLDITLYFATPQHTHQPIVTVPLHFIHDSTILLFLYVGENRHIYTRKGNFSLKDQL